MLQGSQRTKKANHGSKRSVELINSSEHPSSHKNGGQDDNNCVGDLVYELDAALAPMVRFFRPL